MNPSDNPQETFRQYLRRCGLKLTRQRGAILEAFLRVPKHSSVDDVYQEVRRTTPGIGHSTVYRTMKLLSESGLAEVHQFREGRALYESTHLRKHHDHLICVKCGKIVEFSEPDIEQLQERVAHERGFVIFDHRLDLYGHCSDCRSRG